VDEKKNITIGFLLTEVFSTTRILFGQTPGDSEIWKYMPGNSLRPFLGWFSVTL